MSTASDIAKSLKADGQAMTLTRVSGGVLDPVSGTITGEVTQTWTVYGITKRYKASEINASGGLILTGDKQAVIDATVKPLPGDSLTIMGTAWKVISVDELSPQGEALMHYVQYRK